MRLQLNFVAWPRAPHLLGLAVSLVPAIAVAQEREAGDGSVVSKVSAYADDDGTLINTGLVQGDVTLPAGAAIAAHVLVDSISSASVDVISAATPGFEEIRLETGAQARLARPAGEAALSYVRSTENDWSSHSLQVSLARDLAQKNARAQLAYGFTTNVVGRSGDDRFERELVAHTVEAGVTQLLDRKTLVGATYTLQASEGFHSSPYRYVSVGTMGISYLETHPPERLRHAVTLRALRYVAGAAIEATYRLYADDWGIVSHTTTLGVTVPLGKHWDLRLRGRGYYQGAADFWRESYAQPMVYMSADREVSTFWDAGGGVKLAWHLGRWTIDVKVDGYLYRFLDYARLDGRSAIVADAGVRLAW